MKGAEKERNRLLPVKHTHIHKTIPFSETHRLLLAMEGEEQESNGLFLVKHTHMHNTRQFSKTYFLMLAMEQADKKRNRVEHTYKTIQ